MTRLRCLGVGTDFIAATAFPNSFRSSRHPITLSSCDNHVHTNQPSAAILRFSNYTRNVAPEWAAFLCTGIELYIMHLVRFMMCDAPGIRISHCAANRVYTPIVRACTWECMCVCACVSTHTDQFRSAYKTYIIWYEPNQLECSEQR